MNNEDPAHSTGVQFANESDEAYKLAVLAALLNPELCKTNPDEAIKAAEKLLDAVSEQVTARKVMDKQMRDWIEKGAGEQDKEPVAYKDVINDITDEDSKKHRHFGRAEEAFTKFWAYKNGITCREAKHQLRAYKEGQKSFIWGERFELRDGFFDWRWPSKAKKGKQGRVKNPDKDERKRARPTPLSGLRKDHH
jgi:hypothetical protein